MSVSPDYNIAQMILASAVKHRGHVAIRTQDDYVLYDHLHDLIINYALHLRQGGVTRTSCVAIDTEHPILGVVVPLACALLGCSWVKASHSAMTNAAIGITHQIHDGTKHKQERKGVLRITQHWSNPPGGVPMRDRTVFPGFANPDRVWMIAQSSGTTGAAKCMAYSEKIAWHRMFLVPPFEQPERPVSVTLFPPTSTPGLFRILQNLVAGGMCLFRSDLDSFREYRVHHVLGSPNQFAALMQDATISETKIPYIMCGGGAIRKPMVVELLKYFDNFVYRYSSTEAANICNNIISSADGLGSSLSPGRPQDGTRIRILSANGADLGPMQEGIVGIQSPCVVTGYIGEPEVSAKVFRDGWFYPGDIGYLSDAGELYITGRGDDHLNIGGTKLNPEMIDDIIQSHPGVREGACFALPNNIGIDQLAVAVVIVGSMEPDHILKSLEKKIWDKFGPSRTPGDFFILDDLPKNPNGKIVRQQLADAVQEVAPADFDRQ